MRGWGLTIALALAACGDDLAPLDDTVEHGDHVDLWYGAAQRPCGGTLAWLDGYVAREAAYLGLPLDASTPRIAYHYRPRGTPLPCPDGAAGCTYQGDATVYAQPPDFVHELSHAVLFTHGIDPASFFDEGLATALSGPEDPDDPIDYDVALDPLLAADQLPPEAYTTAADLISYLLATRGPAPMLDLLEHTSKGEGAADVRAAFASAYGQSLDDAIAERRASPRAFVEGRLQFPMCSLPPAADNHVELVLGPDDGVGPTYASYPPMLRGWATLDVPVDGDYTLSGSTTALGVAILYSCDGGVQRAFLRGAPATVQLTLPAGRIYVEMATYVANPSRIQLDLAPSGSLR